MMKKIIIDIILDILLGVGIILILIPIIIHWLIYGNYERYLWIISGPYPFSNLGSGPFQLFIYMGLLLLGMLLIISGIVLKKEIRKY